MAAVLTIKQLHLEFGLQQSEYHRSVHHNSATHTQTMRDDEQCSIAQCSATHRKDDRCFVQSQWAHTVNISRRFV